MSCLVAFHYRSYGTFFLHKIGSIISIGDLPTTNIIEPKNRVIIIWLFFSIRIDYIRNGGTIYGNYA